jgi:mannose-1-phosphate guanylyltransferase
VSLFTGVQVLDPALLERLPDGPSDILDLYAPLVEEGEVVQGVRVRGTWYDFGAPPLYLAAQLRLVARQGRGALVDSRAGVDDGARLERSVVGARARVGRGAVVERSVLWEDAVVEPGARVRGSIVTTGATVRAGEEAAGVMVFAPGALPDGDGRDGRDGTWVRMS